LPGPSGSDKLVDGLPVWDLTTGGQPL